MTLDGKPVAERIYVDLKKEIAKLEAEGIRPFLAVILVGEDPASLSYTRKKEETAQSLGISFRLYHFSGISGQNQVLSLIKELNQNKFVHGIVVQLPLPSTFKTETIIGAVAKDKDIDGFLGNYPAPTAAAILEILKHYDIDYHSKKITVVGHGRLVGKPLESLLKKEGIEPVVCDSKTKDLRAVVSKAEILISATGQPGLIRPEMVAPNAVVIDAGTAESEGKLKGDVDPAVYEKVPTYSPVPGGVGPVTVAMLMKNLVKAIEAKTP